MEIPWALQPGAGGPIAGPSAALPAPIMPQVHGATANNGDVNTAGRDVNINVHNHYNSYPDKVDIGAVLGAIRNLRIIHQDVLSKATPGTGVWLFRSKKFLMWVDLNGDLKILWGTGIPGAGKTVLASLVIQELETRAKAAGVRICICYVFIRYSDRADLTVRNILEIIVKQTVERHPNCALLAETAYARNIREKTQPTETELLQLLRQFIEVSAATFYLLDALDEAPDQIQVDLVRKLASLNARLFITSRPLDTVQARIANAHCFPIIAQEADLDLHISKGIACSPNLATLLEQGGSSLREEVVLSIKSKCGGMFLHASLQVDALGECINNRDIKQTLEAFPSSIEDVYRQTWHRILEQRGSQASTAKTLLLWVLNAARPLTIEELRRAAAFSPDNYKYEPDRLVPVTTLIALCRGLITLEEESRIVRLVHYTAQDTLRGLLSDSFSHPQSHLVTVCMSHLTECGFQNTTLRSPGDLSAALRPDEDPLLAYASGNWATHARQSLDVEEAKLRIAVFVKESNAFPAFTDPKRFWTFDILGPFHLLALYDLPVIAPHYIGDPNAITRIQEIYHLTLASRIGNEAAVKSLLAHSKIEVNLMEKRSKLSALMLAAREGHEGIVTLLLARPETQVNLVDRYSKSSALMMAAREGHEGIARLLARPETRVNLMDGQGLSALMLAAAGGHEGIVKLLLARLETLVNLVDTRGSSALMLAVKQGHEGIVELLLAHPLIRVNLVDKHGKASALMMAAREGHEGIIKLLLAHPETQVNLVDGQGLSALMLAASGGREGIVELLLAHPKVQVNLVDTRGSSALMKAAGGGHGGLAKFLLARLEHMVNPVDDVGRWPVLMLPARGGHETIVKLLLARPETLVNLVDDQGWSALMLAAVGGRKIIVELLLAHGEIQVNLVDTRGSSALMMAARKGHEGIVKFLLARLEPMRHPVNDVGRWSALMMCAEGGRNGIAKLLARLRTLICLVGTNGYSTLMGAAAGDHDSLKRFNLACVDPLDDIGRWLALVMPADGGREAIAKLLLACLETLIYIVDTNGSSALMKAAGGRHEGFEKIFLARLEHRANLMDDFGGWLALIKPTRGSYEGIIKLLLAHPETLVNLADDQGCSALMLAAVGGRQGIVELLLARPETLVNLVDSQGSSALMMAAGGGHEGIVKFLLAHPEIKVNLMNKYGGLTALMKATESGHKGIVELLLARPETLPVVNLVDDNGRSALILAILGGHEAIVAMLLAVSSINTTARTTTDWHNPLSLALTKGHTGIIKLLEEFESRQARPYSSHLTLENTMRRSHSALEEPVHEEVNSEWDSEGYQSSSEEWLVGDDTIDADAMLKRQAEEG